jgi:hypothetical protein
VDAEDLVQAQILGGTEATRSQAIELEPAGPKTSEKGQDNQELIQQEVIFVFHLQVAIAGTGISIIAVYLHHKIELTESFKMSLGLG